MAEQIKYNVTGRYMTGSEVNGYHLVGSDGSSLKISRERAISMISRGFIENLRLQNNGDDVIIRGKGINLNDLPIFDLKNDKFRDSNTPETGTTHKNSNVNPLAQYKIVKRIMFKTNCVGYVLQDASGREAKLNRNKTIEYAVKGLVLNADVQKYTQADTKETRLILRGIGCDLKKLPIVIVDQNGNTIDTTNEHQKLNIRATRSRRAGIIYKEGTVEKQLFEPGDYIICTPNGGLKILKDEEAKTFISKSESETAICDSYLYNIKEYTIEFIGSGKQIMSPEIILKWTVISFERN